MKATLRLAAVLLALCGLVSSVALAASSPSITTDKATSVGTSSAVLNGTVNPNGSRTFFRFELGLTKRYGVKISSQQAVSGTAPVHVRIKARGLLPGTVYHFRIDATSAAGSAYGADRRFQTAGNPPPAVATGPATAVRRNGAVVTGVINPNREQTQYFFQYGTTSSYIVQTVPKTVAAGTEPVTVAAALSGLSPGTTYHYRLVALHGSVKQYGADASFFTEPAKRLRPRIRARVSPHRVLFAPFAFTISGHLKLPRGIPAAAACNGNVVAKFFLGRRRVDRELMSLSPNCTFSGRVLFRRAPRAGARPIRLRVSVRFRGNGYIKPARTHRKHILLG